MWFYHSVYLLYSSSKTSIWIGCYRKITARVLRTILWRLKITVHSLIEHQLETPSWTKVRTLAILILLFVYRGTSFNFFFIFIAYLNVFFRFLFATNVSYRNPPASAIHFDAELDLAGETGNSFVGEFEHARALRRRCQIRSIFRCLHYVRVNAAAGIWFENKLFLWINFEMKKHFCNWSQ